MQSLRRLLDAQPTGKETQLSIRLGPLNGTAQEARGFWPLAAQLSEVGVYLASLDVPSPALGDSVSAVRKSLPALQHLVLRLSHETEVWSYSENDDDGSDSGSDDSSSSSRSSSRSSSSSSSKKGGSAEESGGGIPDIGRLNIGNDGSNSARARKQPSSQLKSLVLHAPPGEPPFSFDDAFLDLTGFPQLEHFSLQGPIVRSDCAEHAGRTPFLLPPHTKAGFGACSTEIVHSHTENERARCLVLRRVRAEKEDKRH